MPHKRPHKFSLLQRLRDLHQDTSGALSTEYLLIVVLVVIPIGLLVPMMLSMVRTYGTRLFSMMGLPFP